MTDRAENLDEIDMNAVNAVPNGSDDLFRIFSRFEYALKESGFAKQAGARIEIEWDLFANQCLGPQFFGQIRNLECAPTLINQPPKRQSISENGHLSWKDVDPPTNVQELMGAVCRVRNNLFHGGKSGDSDHGRNEALIQDAKNILLSALHQCEDVRYYFENRW